MHDTLIRENIRQCPNVNSNITLDIGQFSINNSNRRYGYKDKTSEKINNGRIITDLQLQIKDAYIFCLVSLQNET